MFAHDVFASLFGAVRPGELEHLASLVRAVLREGYAVVLNEPGTKKPLCPLSATQRQAADRMAQDAAAERGEANAAARRHACGIAHALTGEEDAKKVTALLTRLTKTYGGTPNIGLEPGRSRLLVVDMDTAGQREAFLEAWGREEPDTAPTAATLYTVRSPGQRGPDGDWAHSDGGHTWFTLPPGVELPTTHDRGVLTDDGGWSLIWSGLQVLVPPSVRAEGPYALIGSPRPAPRFLLERIEQEVVMRVERERLRLERRQERAERADGLDPVDVWSAATPWSVLLEARGWHATGRVDTCSCPTWTAPGPHGSPKSATAHDEGCAVYDSVDGHAPMHIWTDSRPDYLVGAPPTLTKITHEAYADHGGDVSAAVIARDLAVRDGGPMVVDDPFGLGEVSEGAEGRQETPTEHRERVDTPAYDTLEGAMQDRIARGLDGPPPLNPLDGPDDFATPSASSESTPDPQPVHEPAPPAKPCLLTVLSSRDLRRRPRPAPLLYGLLDRGSVALLSGKFGTYKSFLALDWACHVALGRAWEGHDVDQAVPVVYIAAEGDTGMQARVRGWEQRHHGDEPIPDEALAVIPHRVVLETGKDGKATAHLVELVELVKARGAGLVVFDTLSKSRASGTEENSNSDMAALMSLVIELCRATGATVLLVAHTGHGGEHTRGGSAQEDDADSVFVIKFEDPKNEDRGPDSKRVLTHRKAKDGVLSQPRVLVPRVEELGEDDHGRAVTTLTLTTDPFTAAETAQSGPRGALSSTAIVAWFEDQEAPLNLSRRGMESFVRERGLKARTADLWTAYQDLKLRNEQDQQ